MGLTAENIFAVPAVNAGISAIRSKKYLKILKSKMTETQKKIETFFQLEKELWALAGEEDVHYSGLQDCTDDSFAISNGDVLYGTPGTEDYYGGEVYGSALFRGKHYTIAVVDDGQGNRKRPLLFDNNNEVEYEEFEGDD